MSPAGVKVYLVRFPVQRNISAKQTLEDNIHDPQTRKAGQREGRKALGINREELAVGAAKGSSQLQQTHCRAQLSSAAGTF